MAAGTGIGSGRFDTLPRSGRSLSPDSASWDAPGNSKPDFSAPLSPPKLKPPSPPEDTSALRSDKPPVDSIGPGAGAANEDPTSLPIVSTAAPTRSSAAVVPAFPGGGEAESSTPARGGPTTCCWPASGRINSSSATLGGECALRPLSGANGCPPVAAGGKGGAGILAKGSTSRISSPPDSSELFSAIASDGAPWGESFEADSTAVFAPLLKVPTSRKFQAPTSSPMIVTTAQTASIPPVSAANLPNRDRDRNRATPRGGRRSTFFFGTAFSFSAGSLPDGAMRNFTSGTGESTDLKGFS